MILSIFNHPILKFGFSKFMHFTICFL